MEQEGRPRARSVGRTFTDEEWEAQRENFRHYYVEMNMSLKDAARCMKENHDFDATPRQWERRIAPDRWGFQKYESRESRLRQIQQSGRSLLEVSSRGRRKSTASDGRPSMNEDRNMRRFARREVSRDARTRARSVSEVSDYSEQDLSNDEGPSSPSNKAELRDGKSASLPFCGNTKLMRPKMTICLPGERQACLLYLLSATCPDTKAYRIYLCHFSTKACLAPIHRTLI